MLVRAGLRVIACPALTFPAVHVSSSLVIFAVEYCLPRHPSFAHTVGQIRTGCEVLHANLDGITAISPSGIRQSQIGDHRRDQGGKKGCLLATIDAEVFTVVLKASS